MLPMLTVEQFFKLAARLGLRDYEMIGCEVTFTFDGSNSHPGYLEAIVREMPHWDDTEEIDNIRVIHPQETVLLAPSHRISATWLPLPHPRRLLAIALVRRGQTHKGRTYAP